MIYSEQEKFEIFTLYVKNNNNRFAARREYILLYGERRAPSLNTFRRVYDLLSTTKSLKRRKRRVLSNEEEEMEILLYYQGIDTYLMETKIL